VEFPDLMQEKEKLISLFSEDEDVHAKTIRVIASPYRICPLGAHIDHQGGSVLGMTINAFTLMAFIPAKNGVVRLRSRNYPGTVTFDIADIAESTGSFWGVYPRAAVLALQEKYNIKHGISGLVDGMLPGCGLSSSASVLLAYLHALADVNSLEIEPWEFVQLTHQAEKKYIGLNNGILDQTSIVFGKKGYLLHIDTVGEKVTYLAEGLGEDNYRIIVAFSGHSRELTTSGYNSRVDECRMAAQKLSQLAGRVPSELLSGVAQEDFNRFGDELETNLAKRSKHYFSESQRVTDGVLAWQRNSIEEFGRLMNESCRSSMEQYECGIQPICDLQQIVSSTEGVLGSRFMGGGFGGCVVGLVQPDHAAVAINNIRDSYQKLHPEVGEQANVYLARSSDGVRFI
jgi:galacturonokinase